VTECSGRYLAFVDSDDNLPEDAWSEAVQTLESTGSDVAVGALRMLTRDGPRMTARMRENHEVQRLGITIAAQPSLLADVFAHNKIYRRSFWTDQAFAFPEGVRYEDQPLLTDLLLRARAIDVLTTVTYHWQIRADGTSITQGKGRLDDLSDRILTKRWSLSRVVESGDALLRDTFLADVLPVDMFQYFRCVPGADADYWQLLREGMQELWGSGPVAFDQTWIPVQQRLMGWFVLQDRRADLEELIDFIDRNGGPVWVDVDGHREFDHPWRGEPGLPLGVTRVSAAER
jgi:CDP-glycerol glycerophosphotransferase